MTKNLNPCPAYKDPDVPWLDEIIGPLQREGLYRPLLDVWTPPLCQSPDPVVKARGLNYSGLNHRYLGDFDRALEYYEQSLAIQKAIGDVSGLCATLFNMGHMHWQNDQPAEALGAWVTAYQLARQTGWAEALQNLEQLANRLGLPGGLAGWEALARQSGPDA